MSLAAVKTSPVQGKHPTSKAAAKAIVPTAAVLRKRVWDCLVDAGKGGLTDEQMQLRLGMEGSTQRPRRIELVNAKLVKDAGFRRNTQSGRSAIVWVIR